MQYDECCVNFSEKLFKLRQPNCKKDEISKLSESLGAFWPVQNYLSLFFYTYSYSVKCMRMDFKVFPKKFNQISKYRFVLQFVMINNVCWIELQNQTFNHPAKTTIATTTKRTHPFTKTHYHRMPLFRIVIWY